MYCLNTFSTSFPGSLSPAPLALGGGERETMGTRLILSLKQLCKCDCGKSLEGAKSSIVHLKILMIILCLSFLTFLPFVNG